MFTATVAATNPNCYASSRRETSRGAEIPGQNGLLSTIEREPHLHAEPHAS